jgi:hypothetical protein
MDKICASREEKDQNQPCFERSSKHRDGALPQPQEWVLVNKKQKNKIGYNNGPEDHYSRGQAKASNYKIKTDHLEYEVITRKRNGQTKSYKEDKI